MKRLLLTTALLLIAAANTAHAQYYGYGNSAFGDGVASTYGYGATPPRLYPWNRPIIVTPAYPVYQPYTYPTYPAYTTPIRPPVYYRPYPLRRW